MTIKELIEALSNYPLGTEVYFDTGRGAKQVQDVLLCGLSLRRELVSQDESPVTVVQLVV